MRSSLTMIGVTVWTAAPTRHRELGKDQPHDGASGEREHFRQHPLSSTSDRSSRLRDRPATWCSRSFLSKRSMVCHSLVPRHGSRRPGHAFRTGPAGSDRAARCRLAKRRPESRPSAVSTPVTSLVTRAHSSSRGRRAHSIRGWREIVQGAARSPHDLELADDRQAVEQTALRSHLQPRRGQCLDTERRRIAAKVLQRHIMFAEERGPRGHGAEQLPTRDQKPLEQVAQQLDIVGTCSITSMHRIRSKSP